MNANANANANANISVTLTAESIAKALIKYAKWEKEGYTDTDWSSHNFYRGVTEFIRTLVPNQADDLMYEATKLYQAKKAETK